jgi:hypothetical protein
MPDRHPFFVWVAAVLRLYLPVDRCVLRLLNMRLCLNWIIVVRRSLTFNRAQGTALAQRSMSRRLNKQGAASEMLAQRAVI